MTWTLERLQLGTSLVEVNSGITHSTLRLKFVNDEHEDNPQECYYEILLDQDVPIRA